MPDQLRDIVARMVQAGEKEEDIAAVIQRLSTPDPVAAPEEAPAPTGISAAYAEALRSKGIEPTPQQLAANQRMTEGALGGGLSSAAPTAVGQAVQQFAPGVSRALKGGAERLYGGLLKAKDATVERFPNVLQDLLVMRERS